jgi:hypothetical protein
MKRRTFLKSLLAVCAAPTAILKSFSTTPSVTAVTPTHTTVRVPPPLTLREWRPPTSCEWRMINQDTTKVKK